MTGRSITGASAARLDRGQSRSAKRGRPCPADLRPCNGPARLTWVNPAGVGAAQTFGMRAAFRLVILAGIALGLAQGAGADADADGADRLPAYSVAYDLARDPGADARAAFALAAASGRRVLIEAGGDWCHWCYVLDRLLAREPALARRLHRAFVVLKVAIDEDHDGAAVLADYPRPDGYPYLYVVAADGVLVHAQDAVAFVEEHDYSARRVDEFIERWDDGHE